MFRMFANPLGNKTNTIQNKVIVKTIFLVLSLFFVLCSVDLQSSSFQEILSLQSQTANAQVAVTSCEQFQGTAAAGTNLIDNPAETFEMQNDIDCLGASISPIFPSNNKFTGIFEGNDFTLSNFTVPAATRSSVFGYASNSTIQNLTIRDADATCNSGGHCAVLLADDVESTLNNISLINTTLTQSGGQDRMGPLIGTGLGSQVSNITVDTFELTCTQIFSGACQYLGGALGFISDNAGTQAFIQNVSVNNATVYGYDRVGGVIGYISESNADNLTATNVELGGITHVGGVVGQLLGTNGLEAYLNNSNASNITHTPQAYLTAVGGSNTSTSAIGGLIGTSSNYTSVNCGGETTNFTNIPLTNTSKVGGLIGDANFLAATASDAVNYTVENCQTTGSVSGTTYIGGVIGEAAEGRYNNLSSTTNINMTGSNPVAGGGIIGWLDFANPVTPFGLTNSSYNGIITASGAVQNLGGLVGDVDHASIDSCTVDVSIITPEGLRIAGAVGNAGGSSSADNTISNITANVRLQGEQYLGGIVGQNSMYLLDSNSTSGTIEGNSSELSRYAGGIAGQNSGTSSGVRVSTTNSNSSVDIRNIVTYAGGLVGFNTYAPVTNSYATGDVHAFQGYVGGLIGGVQNGGASYPIDQVYATGDVSGDSLYQGGLIGQMGSATPVSNAYATGDVAGRKTVGGLIGIGSNVPITNSYSVGQVTGGEDVGGLIGDGNGSTITTDSYWDVETSNRTYSYAGEGKTTQEMYTPATFATWDSDTIWDICTNNYPVLKSLGQSCPVPEPLSFTVNTNQDTSDQTPGDSLCEDSNGSCSLRAALEEYDALNDSTRENRIIFDLSSTARTITLTGALPVVNGLQINIDGTSQDGFAGQPIINIDASAITGSDPVLEFRNADSSTLQGIAIYGESHSADASVLILNSDGAQLKDNYFGYNSASSLVSTQVDLAIQVDNSDQVKLLRNQLTNPIDILDSDESEVSQNEFNLSTTPTNDYAIQFRDGANSLFVGNYIQNIARGIVVRDDSAAAPVESNDIRENTGRNVTLMIDLLDDGSVATDGNNENDLDDTDEGPNKLINKPELTEAQYDNSSRKLTVTGDFNSTDGNYRFDFYTSDGSDEARKYINFFYDSVVGNTLNFSQIDLFLPENGIVPSYITATAQDEDLNTSEHSDPLEVDSILITSCDQLAGGNPAAVSPHIEDDYTGFYRLANDIDCSDYTGGTTFDPIGSSSSHFRGVLVGDGYTISNLEINDPGTYIGLFAELEGGIIQNINFENVSVTCSTNASNYCGLISGNAVESFLEDITVTQGTGIGVNGLGTYTGGLLGFMEASSVTNIISDMDVIGNTVSDQYFGGIVGKTDDDQPTNRGYFLNYLEDITMTGDVSGYQYTGGIVGQGEDVYINNVSYDGTITPYTTYAGGIAGQTTSSSTSDLQSVVINSSANATIISAASGNINSIGVITGSSNNTQNENLTATGSIDATNFQFVGGAFGTIAGSSAFIDGNNISEDTPHYAKNIDVDVDITNGKSRVGGVAGNASYTLFTNIDYNGTISHDAPSTSHPEIGGLIGYGTYIIVDGGSSQSDNPITYGTSSVGGAFGSIIRLNADNVTSSIDVSASGDRVGGLAGSVTFMDIQNSNASGSVISPNSLRVGGLVGSCSTGDCVIEDSYATGDISGEQIYVGGLAGELATTSSVTVNNSYATGSVESQTGPTGGLVGSVSATGGININNAYATGNVTSLSFGDIGGLIGRHQNGTLEINQSYSSGNLATSAVNGTSHCGGIIATSSSTLNITESYTYGDINCQSLGTTATAHGFGGLVGEMSTGTILESYSHSDITGDYDGDGASEDGRLGGLIGYITGVTSVIDSYSTGSVTSLYSAGDPTKDPIIGGLVGEAPSTTFTDSFWDTQTSGVLVSAGGTGKLTSEMQDQDTFTTGGPDWDFASTWEMCAGGGYPTHQWMNYCPLDNPYTFEVNTTNDTEDSELGDRTCLDAAGDCSLRAAIEEMIFMQANEQESVSYNINFDIAGAGPHIIALDNSLGYFPELNSLSNLLIDGESEPSFVANPVIYIDASALTTANQSVFDFEESAASSIRGLGVLGFQELDDAAFNISNSSNISLSNIKSAITSAGALDGTTSTNSLSVQITNSSNSSILNSELARPIDILAGSNSNTIQGNDFDLRADDYAEAIYIENSSANTIQSNTFNTAQVAIAINQQTGQTANTNTLSQNTAQNISTRVIELQVNGTPSANTNDIAQDLDNGANTLLNFPVIADGEYDPDADTLRLQGTVETANGADYYIEFFESDGSTDEALSYLGSSDPFTVSDNLYNFDITLNGVTSIPLNATATLTDVSGNTSQHSTSTSLNDAPSDIQISNNNVDETPPAGAFDTTSVGTLTTTDADAGDTHTYQILSIDGDPAGTEFSIGGISSDELIQEEPFDYEIKTSYDVAIRTTDSSGVSYDETITIFVNDLNDNAPDLISETFNVAESNGAPSATLTVNDPDTVGTVTLTITGGADQNDFQISGTTLSFKAAALPLDFETKNQYVVEVTASDGANADDTEEFTFNITDVNEAPTVVNPVADITVDQDEAIPSVNATNIFADQDAGANGNLAYSATLDDASPLPDWLNFDGTTLTGTPTNSDVGTYAVRITATDGGGIQNSDLFDITVNNLNDPPSIDDQTFDAISEDSPNGTSVGTVVATDIDPGETLQFTITAGNTGSAFSIGLATGEITVNDTTAIDYETQTSFALTVEVEDSGSSTSSATITIPILDADDTSPVITADQTGTVPENAPADTIIMSVLATDIDTAGNLNNWQIVSGDPNETFQIDQHPTNQKQGQITVQSPTFLDYEATQVYTLGIQVSDGTNTSSIQTVEITVTDQNDNSPIITSDQTASIDENSADNTIVFTPAATDVDTNTTLQDWTITGGTGQTRFTVDSTTGEITYNSAGGELDFETQDSYTLTLTVSDGVNTSEVETVTINLTDINESPSLADETVSIDENLANTTQVIDLEASDPDAGSTLSFAITSGNQDIDEDTVLPFSIDSSTGVITVADSDDLNFEEIQLFTLQVSVTDDGTGNLTDTASITINLNNLNDTAPTITSPGTVSQDENSTSIITIESTDPDNIGDITYSLSGGPDQALFQIDGVTGVLAFEIAPDFENPLDADTNNIYQVQVTATDEAGNATNQLISIQVQDINEAEPEEENTPSSSGSSSGGGGSTSNPFSGNNSAPESSNTESDSNLNGDDATPEDNQNNEEQDQESDLDDEDQSDDLTPNEPQNNQGEPEENDNLDPSPDGTTEDPTQDESPGESDAENNSSNSGVESDSDADDVSTDEPQNNQDEPEDETPPGSSGSSSGGGSGGSGSNPFTSQEDEAPQAIVVSCDNLDTVDYSEFDYAQLDCDPLQENQPEEVVEDEVVLSINLSRTETSSFPDQKFFITGKVYNAEDVTEVEVYAEIAEGNSFALGRASVDDLGNFSLLNQTSIPENKDISIKAVALREDGPIESPDYSVKLAKDGPSAIPTNIISFVGRSESELFNGEDGYFTFVDTQDLENKLELRVESQFRTRHDVYWNSVLIASSAITGLNSNQTVLYAPEEVISDITPFSRHKVTVVARSLDNPNQKGIPQVINYIYVPTATYYAGLGLLILLLIVVLSVRRKKKINSIDSV